MTVEEEVLYPAAADVLDQASIDEATVEHAVARSAMQMVVDLVAEGQSIVAAVEALQAGIAHHVEDEEGELFPRIRQHANELPDDMSEQLSQGRTGRAP